MILIRIFLINAGQCVQRLKLYMLYMFSSAKSFHEDGRATAIDYTHFSEISEREDAVYDFFELFLCFPATGIAAPIEKNQFLNKRRKREGMCISCIDSFQKLWDYDTAAKRVRIPEG